MRIATSSTTVIQISRSASFGRRQLAPVMPAVTCLALVRHRETEKALLVSDCADETRAVWCPKVLLQFDRVSPDGFIVATMAKRFAERKGLCTRFIDTEGWAESRIIALRDAEGAAARKRNQLAGHRDPLPRPGRNAFA